MHKEPPGTKTGRNSKGDRSPYRQNRETQKSEKNFKNSAGKESQTEKPEEKKKRIGRRFEI